MLYKIDWLEVKKTSTGKNLKRARLIDESGVEIEDVSIWDNFPNWADLRPGGEVTGEVKSNDKGYKSLYEIKEKRGAPAGIKAAQERKAEMIEKAQGRKNDSIAYFNSLNSAISFVSNFKNEMSVSHAGDAYDLIIQYRDKFLEEWKAYEAQDITDKRKPF